MKKSIFFVGLVVLAAALLCGRTCGKENVTDDDIKILKRTGKAFASVAKKAIPAVVSIEAEKTVEVEAPRRYRRYEDPLEELFEHFFRGRGFYYEPRQYRQTLGGSGFIISKDGYILTNNHIVGDADKIIVKLHDGREFKAKRTGSDPRSEVAVIKIDGKNFPFIELGDSSKLEIGEWVIAVGNTFRLPETLTVGVVSAKGRSNIGITQYEDFIQTDAAINRGNSGGPLLNIEGKAIGINTFILATVSGGYVGAGFAIPINIAKTIKDQLIKTGKVIRGFLGVKLNREDIDEDTAKFFGLKKAGGVLVTEVIEDSPAEKAGLKEEDIILQVNGKAVENNSSFMNTIAFMKPGTKVTLTIFRNGKERKMTATLGTFPEDVGADVEALAEASDAAEKIGLSVENMTPDLAGRFGYETEEGVIVSAVETGSPAYRKGIEPGDLILEVNRQTVSNTDEFYKALSRSEKTGRVLLVVKDKRGTWFVLLRID